MERSINGAAGNPCRPTVASNRPQKGKKTQLLSLKSLADFGRRSSSRMRARGPRSVDHDAL